MERYKEWLDRARSSLELAQTQIIRHIHYEELCFQIQQAVEKAFKGLLIYYDIEPEFTHNIGILYEKIEEFMNVPENIKESADLTRYAVETRYPGEYDDITKEEYERSLKIAKDCLEWVESKINEDINKKQTNGI